MVRYETGEYPRFAYGTDFVIGVFFNLYDPPLEWGGDDASDEVREAISTARSRFDGPDEEQAYLHLHTGPVGFGLRVTDETLRTFLDRYGVLLNEHIVDVFEEDRFYRESGEQTRRMNVDELVKGPLTWHTICLLQGVNIGPPPAESKAFKRAKALDANRSGEIIDKNVGVGSSTVFVGKCAKCGKEAKNRCANCSKSSAQNWFYCSKECQKADWAVHKHFCSLKMLPKTTLIPPTILAVAGLIFVAHEKEKKPRLIEVLLQGNGQLHSEWYPKSIDLILGDYRTNRSHPTPRHVHFGVEPARDMDDTLVFFYRDNFFKDGSERNVCIRSITNGKAPIDWRGNVLVMKIAGKKRFTDSDAKWLDMGMDDAADVVEFFNTFKEFECE